MGYKIFVPAENPVLMYSDVQSADGISVSLSMYGFQERSAAKFFKQVFHRFIIFPAVHRQAQRTVFCAMRVFPATIKEDTKNSGRSTRS